MGQPIQFTRSRVGWYCLLCLVFPVLGACASSIAQRGGANVLTFEMLQEAAPSHPDAYGLIHQLRPHWLQSRGATSLESSSAPFAVVYVNGSRMGHPRVLRQIGPNELQQAEYLSASAATIRFGTGHASGVILIITR